MVKSMTRQRKRLKKTTPWETASHCVYLLCVRVMRDNLAVHELWIQFHKFWLQSSVNLHVFHETRREGMRFVVLLRRLIAWFPTRQKPRLLHPTRNWLRSTSVRRRNRMELQPYTRWISLRCSWQGCLEDVWPWKICGLYDHRTSPRQVFILRGA